MVGHVLVARGRFPHVRETSLRIGSSSKHPMRNDEREGNEEAGFVVGGRGVIASPEGRRGAGCAGGPSPLSIKADPVSVAVGKPVTFTIGKTNVLPSDL